MTGARDLDGRVALVTGGSRGIGLAAARALAARGASVVVTARTQDAADAAAATIGGDATGVAAHASDEDATQRTIGFVVDRLGRLDVLVNNAATSPYYGPTLGIDRERFDKTVAVNLWAPLRWTAVAHERWMGEHGGVVVNVASIGGLGVETGLGGYNLTKAALIHLTRQLAVELGPAIRVVGVAPGVVRTKFASALWQDDEPALRAITPLGRIGEPPDVGAAIAFLASDEASWITGETLVIDGGISQQPVAVRA